jgi:hypothetical protein
VSDPSAELIDAILTTLKADAALAAVFPGRAVRAFDLPPTNLAMPYVVVGDGPSAEAGAAGYDGADTNLHLHVWSRTSPVGMREGKTIAAAAVVALQSGAVVLASHRLVQLLWRDTNPLLENDGETVHVVVRFEISTEPV